MLAKLNLQMLVAPVVCQKPHAFVISELKLPQEANSNERAHRPSEPEELGPVQLGYGLLRIPVSEVVAYARHPL